MNEREDRYGGNNERGMANSNLMRTSRGQFYVGTESKGVRVTNKNHLIRKNKRIRIWHFLRKNLHRKIQNVPGVPDFEPPH